MREEMKTRAVEELLRRGEAPVQQEQAESYVSQAGEMILTYTGIEELGEEMFYLLVSLAEELAKGQVSEVYQGDTKIKFSQTEILDRFRPQLNRFRRMKHE